MKHIRFILKAPLALMIVVALLLTATMIPLAADASGLSQHPQRHTPHVFLNRKHAVAASTSGNLIYHGGQVMTGTTHVYAIYWEPTGNVSARYHSLINNYFSEVGGSPLYEIQAQYAQSSGAFPMNAVLTATWTDHRAYPGNPVFDGDIRQEVANALLANNWFANSSDIFFVFTQSNEDVCESNTTRTTGCASNTICGYHSYIDNNTIYAAIPYQNNPNCKTGYEPNNDDADQTINIVSHEQMEAASDPFLNAWFDPSGQEIGDKCAWQFPSNSDNGDVVWNSQRFIVQEEWDNASSSCRLVIGGTRGASQTVSQPNGTVDTFFTGTDHALYHDTFSRGAGWLGPFLMPGTAPMHSEPSAVTSSPGVVDVFWLGADANLWHVFYIPGSGWTGTPQSLGDGPLGGPPEAVAQSDGSIQVFWHGMDNNLWHAWYTPGSGWAGPGQLTSTGNVLYNPAPVLSKDGTWDVFWEGTDSNLWHVYQNPGDGGWTIRNLGDGPLGGGPHAVGQPDGSIEVFWTGTDYNVWHAWYFPGSNWAGPERITSTANLSYTPIPVNSRTGTWDVFWKGSNGDLWHVFWIPGSSHWTTQDLGDGILGDTPFATGQPSGTIDVFWRGNNSPAALWHAWYNPGSPWAGPQNLGGSVF